MINIKRVLSLTLVVLLLSGIALMATSCKSSGGDFPVTVGNITIEKEPEKIVALSDNVADILSTIGYDIKLTGRSEECNQEFLSVVPVVGTKAEPDANTIIEDKTDIVFADQSLDQSIKEQLKAANVKVITIYCSESMEELEILYRSIGTILGGNNTGKKKASDAFQSFETTLDDISRLAPNEDVLNTICYLYMENNQLKTFTGNTYKNSLLEFTGAINVANNFESEVVEEDILKLSNPSFIFYNDKKVLDYLKDNEKLKDLNAISSKSIYELPMENFTRQGNSSIDTVSFMLGKMYPELETNNKTTKPSKPETNNGDAPTPVDIQNVADQYNIKLTEGMELKLDDDNDDVMALQKRLDDLDFLPVAPTGYFGDLTTRGVKDFQYINNMEQTGRATYEVLKIVFDADAKKNPNPAREKQ